MQNLQHKSGTKTNLHSPAILDRLTLALVDRLPTDSEREFARVRGSHGLFDLANYLVQSREFFDRQSLYWNTQLRQTPAWLWESQNELNWDRFFASESDSSSGKIYFFPAAERGRGETVCNGVWSVFLDKKPMLCGCDDTVDVLPYWDSSSSMRVCPIARQDTQCGPALEKCLPVDARLETSVVNLEVDKESAGGRAITRMISDLSLAHGRAIALGVVTHQKWSRLQNANRTVVSKSSLDLVKGWVKKTPDSPILALASALKIDDIRQSTKTFLLPSINPQRSRGTRLVGESNAEELFLSPQLEERVLLHPLRGTRLSTSIWEWSSNLLFTCQIPHLAPQVFTLPVPHPEAAKEGSYFCSGCHLSMEKFASEQAKNKEQNSESRVLRTGQRDSQLRECAVDHALQFLLGFRPTGNELKGLRKKGSISYSQNQESMSSLIRDLSIQIAIEGGEK